jgi:hypothetical protein
MQTVQYLNNSSCGQNLRSTPGQAEPIAQYFIKISTAKLLHKAKTQLHGSCTKWTNRDGILNL